MRPRLFGRGSLGAPRVGGDDATDAAKQAPVKQAPAEEVSQEGRKVRRWSFLVHLVKRRQEGEYSWLQGGLGGLRHEYSVYKERKQKTEAKYLTYETVVENATDSAEYYVLLILSCLIATFGLINDSAAVIIGAMIVAPLMGPILGLSAGVLWGSARVVFEAVTTLLWGVLIVLGITVALTFLIPFVPVSGQILARTAPNLLDIGIALASGLVGAYAYANKKVSASIPGVAISVALMPPLCTIGIGLGLQRWDVARGAATLFGVNLLGISLAALVVFYLVDLHPHVTADAEEKERIHRRVIGQLLITLFVLGILASPMVLASRSFIEGNRLRQTVNTYIRAQVPPEELYELELLATTPELSVRVLLLGGPEERDIDTWRRHLERETSRPVSLHLFRLHPLGNP